MTPNSVLIIENEATSVTMVERSLQNEGYSIHKAADAEAGFKMARELVPSIILMNLAVPGANGLEICKTIHTDEILKDVPLILLTLREGKFDPIYTKLYGIVNFLKKPFTPDQLIECMREFAPFQAGAEAPAMGALDETVEPETSYGGIDEPMEPQTAFVTDMDESLETETSYGGLDEPIEPSVDYVMSEEPEDSYSLDENTSLDEAQASFDVSDDFSASPDEEEAGMSAGDFQDTFTMTPQEESISDSGEDDYGSFTAGEEEDLSSGQEEEVVFSSFSPTGDAMESFEQEETASSGDERFQMSSESLEEMPTETLSAPQEDMDLSMPSGDIPTSEESGGDKMDFDLPSESPEFDVSLPEVPENRKGRRKRASSRGNRPKGKRTLVLALVAVLFVALAGASAWFFFLSEPEAPQVAKAPPTQTAQKKPLSPPPAQPVPAPAGKPAPPAATQPTDVPPPPGTPATATAPPQRTPEPKQTTAPEADVLPKGEYTVQFGVFGSRKNAENLIGKLRNKGLKVFIKEKPLPSGKTLHYVLLSEGFKDRDSASRKSQELRRESGFDAAVHKL